MMRSVVLPEEAFVQAAHLFIGDPGQQTVRARFLGWQKTADYEFAGPHEHAIRGSGASEAQLIPSNARRCNLRDGVEIGEEAAQSIFAILRHLTTANQEDHDAFEDPIVECVEDILVELAYDASAHRRHCRRGTREIDPPPDGVELL